MVTKQGTGVTGCAGRFPMLDRNGRQLRVGDTLLAQVCIGRYGKVKQVQVTVDEPHYQLAFLDAPGGGVINFHCDHEAHVLRGYLNHTDVEHAHEQWSEIIASAA